VPQHLSLVPWRLVLSVCDGGVCVCVVREIEVCVCVIVVCVCVCV